MTSYFSQFLADEDGAVTVDFVVLTAAITILGLVAGAQVVKGASDLGRDHGTQLANREVGINGK